MDKIELLIIIFGSVLVLTTTIGPIIKLFSLISHRTKYQKLGTSSRIFLLHQLDDAVKVLAENMVGALITIERKQDLENLRTDGLNLDSNVSSFLLIALFQKTSPLHDGAVIVEGDRIKYAGTFYHITEQSVSNNYGARHRAALGISEQSDSVSIVVSEETGKISFVKDGKIVELGSQNFQDALASYLK